MRQQKYCCRLFSCLLGHTNKVRAFSREVEKHTQEHIMEDINQIIYFSVNNRFTNIYVMYVDKNVFTCLCLQKSIQPVLILSIRHIKQFFLKI